MDVKLGFSH